MISSIEPRHHAGLLAMNREFVHWLSPMDEAELQRVLKIAHYARQIDDGAGVLIGYGHDAAYPDHQNMDWLRQRFDDFFYIDRIIVAAAAQGRGHARALYADIEGFARDRGHRFLCCEVNTRPDNPGSHRFHETLGFEAIGERICADQDKAVRYYAKAL